MLMLRLTPVLMLCTILGVCLDANDLSLSVDLPGESEDCSFHEGFTFVFQYFLITLLTLSLE